MAITDIIILLGFLVLALTAAYRGLIHTLFWPLAIVTSSLLSIGVYFISNNLWCTLAIYVLCAFLIRKLRPIFQKKTDPSNPAILSPANRIIAVGVNLVWGLFLAFLIVLMLSLVPFERFGLSDISYDIFHSKTYDKIAEIIIIPTEKTTTSPKTCAACASELQDLMETPITQELLKDPRILKLISDPEFQDALSKKDMAKLSRNPILLELRHDPKFLLNAVRLHMTMRANTQH
ncbi:MAG: CvpA family protein [Candidatus Omnitrophica bacterium]|nr:CvpA family protein [Candidatus Omnitrophota bacterium]